ncbi:hypothetical protein [Acidocella sp.]|uniref:hypothetical protein n=1 Tax=Acidocella sp. TaxID=50710 RepID=UPI002629BC31|nr:hypothetical protein [Acidocella sp.]
MKVPALWTRHAAAAAAYALIVALVVWHGVDLRRTLLGGDGDSTAFVWYLGWWPYALSHYLNPFFSTMVWAPQGLNLIWVNCIPVIALLAWPLTRAFGVAVSYDLLTLATPLLNALAAYAFCFALTRRVAAAWFGGFLFAFSSYAMARQNDQLNLSLTAVLPLVAWLVWARFGGRVGRARAVALAAVLMALEAGISLEIFALGVVFAAYAWGLAWWRLPERRAALGRMFVDALWVAPVLLVLVAPLIWPMVTGRHDMHLPAAWPDYFSTDPLNFIIPTATTWLGGAWCAPLSHRFAGLVGEQAAYLGVPLVVVLWGYLRRRGYLAWLLGGVLVASLGPHLWLGGVETGLPMPWAMFHALPLLDNALPARFMLFAALVIAPVGALWLAESGGWRRLLGAGLVVLTLWPAPRPAVPRPDAPLFAPGRLVSLIGADQSVLVLPVGFHSSATYWQAQSGFGFRLTSAYLGFPPVELQRDRPMIDAYLGLAVPDLARQIEAYAKSTGTDYIIATPQTPPSLLAGLGAAGWGARTVDGMVLFKVSQP